MTDPDVHQTALFLWQASQSLSTTCPPASRYCMVTLGKHVGNALVSHSFLKSHRYCKHCGSFWNSTNHRIRIQPILPPNRHIKKLLKLEKEQPWKLNNRQKKKLKKHKESRNKLNYTCHVCKRTSSFVGLKKYSSREREMLVSTPASKIKLKKGDINAGLFVKTPTEKKIRNKSETYVQDNSKDETPFQASISQLMDSTFPSNKPNTMPKAHITQEKMKKNPTPQNTSASKKKRKGLLAQILNQEQEAKQQKKTLTSFLTSL